MDVEAKRLGVKWILGGECSHMWRVLHQYMDTMNGPADFLQQPVSPITKTHFDNAATTKMVHICEFTSDLIRNKKIKLDPSRNDNYRVTFHDSCNPARALAWLAGPSMSAEDPSDMLIVIAAEDGFDAEPDLSRVAAPTLVVGG